VEKIYTLVNQALVAYSPPGSGFDSPVPSGSSIDTGGKFKDLPTTIATLFNFIIGVAAVVFVILLMVGGITYLTGAGNEEQVNKSKKLMIDSIIGLVVVLAAWAIGTYVLNAFGYSVS